MTPSDTGTTTAPVSQDCPVYIVTSCNWQRRVLESQRADVTGLLLHWGQLCPQTTLRSISNVGVL